MTTVHVSMARDDGTGTLAALPGSLYWEPTTRREDGTVVVLPVGFAMNLTAGEATKDVEPSGLTWCWRVTERVEDGTVRYVSVPDSATTVEYTDLVDVDPDTLVAWSPADPEAAYQNALDNLDVETAVETYLLANPVTVSDADATTKGILKLTNDLGGTADLPTVPGLADKANTADLGTAAAADTGDFVATADLTVTTGASISGANTGDQDLSGYATTASLATVATSGDYNDLTNRPTFKTVTNRTGSAIPADTLVEIDGAFGISSTIRVATNVTADHVAGITTEAIADGADGEIQVTGTVEGLTTNDLTAGEALYLGVDGAWTNTRPTAPAHIIRVGVAGVIHPTAGSIVFTLPSFELLAPNVDGLDAAVTAFAEDPTSELAVSLSDTYEPLKGADDNYVTDAEKAALHTHPAVIAQGATQADARAAIGAGTSSLVIGTTAGTAKAGDYTPDLSGYLTSATAATTYVAQADLTVTTGASVSGSNTGDQDLSGYATITQTINAQTGTTYTLVAADASKLVTCTNAGAITVTLPQDSAATIAVGSRVDFAVLGAGMVTFAADAGSTVNGTPSLVTRAQYSAVTAIKLAADTWLVVGDLATP